MEGFISYAIYFGTMISIYGLLSLALNVQWGYTGMLNIGVAAFFAVGAYTSAILTSPENSAYLGGFDLPLVVGFICAALICAVLAFAIGLLTLNLRTDYLAIATIGIAEIVRLILKNEEGLTNGVRGMGNIPRPFKGLIEDADDLLFLIFATALLLAVYLFCEKIYNSPWGRAQRAIRENETAAEAMGKNILSFRLQAFVIGSAIMGLAGALYAHFTGFISPEAFDPLFATFLVWVMLIAGGSGNNRGAILGAAVIWAVWSGSEVLISRLPETMMTQAGSLRLLLVGVLLEVILLIRPAGILPEKLNANS